MQITTWNVNGIRTNIFKTGTSKKKISEQLTFQFEQNSTITQILKHDIVCLQETKCTKEEGETIFGHCLNPHFKYRYWNSAVSGVGGVAIFSKIKPTEVVYEFPRIYYLNKGRVIIVKFELDNQINIQNSKNLIIINTYVPNTGRPEAWKNRIQFNNAVSTFLSENIESNVIWTGDLNVVNDPKLDTIYKGTKLKEILKDESIDKRAPSIGAGLTLMERSHLHRVIEMGYVDVFRTLYPDEKKFSWYSYRSPNTGYRLDYFIIPQNMIPLIKDIVIFPKNLKESDHVPVSLIIN